MMLCRLVPRYMRQRSVCIPHMSVRISAILNKVLQWLCKKQTNSNGQYYKGCFTPHMTLKLETADRHYIVPNRVSDWHTINIYAKIWYVKYLAFNLWYHFEGDPGDYRLPRLPKCLYRYIVAFTMKCEVHKFQGYCGLLLFFVLFTSFHK